MYVLGIDLSGPRNVADTCAALFKIDGSSLQFEQAIPQADDPGIYSLVSNTARTGAVSVGLDAPLSYNAAGGYRPADAELSRVVRVHGRTGIMAPTMTRMVYLTLHGLALSRALETLKPRADVRIVEVHPGAAMLLHGAPAADVAAFKADPAARLRLFDWMETMGLGGLPRSEPLSDHFVAACGAALAAWHWALGTPAWCATAQPPEHPYDFAC